MAESLHHSPETVTTLLIGYTLIQNISGVKKYKESKSTIDMLVYSVAKSCLTLCDPIDCSLPGSSVHGDSLGKNTGVSCHFLLQGLFPTQESNLGLLHCRQILYRLSYEGSPSHMLDLWNLRGVRILCLNKYFWRF